LKFNVRHLYHEEWVSGEPDEKHISSDFVERQNLSIAYAHGRRFLNEEVI